jgi:DNA anti-recombination protein RmuC
LNDSKLTISMVDTRFSRLCCRIISISSEVAAFQNEIKTLRIERRAINETRLLDEMSELGKIRSANLRERSRLREGYNAEKLTLSKDLHSMNVTVESKRKELSNLENAIREKQSSMVQESPEVKLKSLQELYESAQKNFETTLSDYQATIRASKRDLHKLKVLSLEMKF